MLTTLADSLGEQIKLRERSVESQAQSSESALHLHRRRQAPLPPEPSHIAPHLFAKCAATLQQVALDRYLRDWHQRRRRNHRVLQGEGLNPIEAGEQTARLMLKQRCCQSTEARRAAGTVGCRCRHRSYSYEDNLAAASHPSTALRHAVV